MYAKKVVGLAEAQEAMKVMIEEASKEQPDRPMAFAIADEHGDLVCVARMDGALAFNMTMAIRKAYSAAWMKRSTRQIEERLRPYNRTLADALGLQSNLTNLPGGEIIIEPNEGYFIGTVGASGRHADVDEALAKKGVESIQNSLKAKK